MRDLILGTLALAGIGFMATEGSYILYQHYAPRYEQVRRETFEQSQAYNEGMLRDLDTLALQYSQADGPSKLALRAVILERFAAYDTQRLPPRLQSFYSSLRDSQ